MIKFVSGLGWTLRALALVWIVSIVLSVATAADGFTTVQGILAGVAFHAVCAVGGVQLVGLSKKMKARREVAAA